MNNDRGQALVEFVIIIPILIFVIMAIIDFGNIAFKKIKLENLLDEVVLFYENDEMQKINKLTKDNDVLFNYVNNANTTTITLKQNVRIFTPFLNLVLTDNYLLETKRVIYD